MRTSKRPVASNFSRNIKPNARTTSFSIVPFLLAPPSWPPWPGSMTMTGFLALLARLLADRGALAILRRPSPVADETNWRDWPARNMVRSVGTSSRERLAGAPALASLDFHVLDQHGARDVQNDARFSRRKQAVAIGLDEAMRLVGLRLRQLEIDLWQLDDDAIRISQRKNVDAPRPWRGPSRSVCASDRPPRWPIGRWVLAAAPPPLRAGPSCFSTIFSGGFAVGPVSFWSRSDAACVTVAAADGSAALAPIRETCRSNDTQTKRDCPALNPARFYT